MWASNWCGRARRQRVGSGRSLSSGPTAVRHVAQRCSRSAIDSSFSVTPRTQLASFFAGWCEPSAISCTNSGSVLRDGRGRERGHVPGDRQPPTRNARHEVVASVSRRRRRRKRPRAQGLRKISAEAVAWPSSPSTLFVTAVKPPATRIRPSRRAVTVQPARPVASSQPVPKLLVSAS